MEAATVENATKPVANGIVYDSDYAPGNASEFIPGQYNTALTFRLF